MISIIYQNNISTRHLYMLYTTSWSIIWWCLGFTLREITFAIPLSCLIAWNSLRRYMKVLDTLLQLNITGYIPTIPVLGLNTEYDTSRLQDLIIFVLKNSSPIMLSTIRATNQMSCHIWYAALGTHPSISWSWVTMDKYVEVIQPVLLKFYEFD